MPSIFLALTLFLLSADLLFVEFAGQKIKYGYFLVVAAWCFSPLSMLAAVRAALARVPRYAWLPLLPLAGTVMLSANVRDSVAWCLWLAFDMFTIATIYAFLKVHAFAGDEVQRCATWSLGLMAAFGIVQYIAIYMLGRPLFGPQYHLGVYRLNGLAGWPHFLNIFAFLLLPIVIVERRLSWTTRVLIALLLFVLVQSTAKTGWALLIALGLMLLMLDRRSFRANFAAFLLPVVAIALIVPTPSFQANAPMVTATAKISAMSADLDVTDISTSGTDRVLIARMGLAVWWKHPWFGVGPRAYDDFVFTRFDRELPGVNKLDGNGNVNAKNENIWIELLAENGALFTLALVFVLLRALWIPRLAFANPLHLGAWIALVLYFGISGQVSQTGLLTMVYAVFGIYLYARELPARPP